MRVPTVLGTDFDNTIVDYGHLFPQVAASQGIDAVGGQWHKRTLRRHLRSLPDGEIRWQKIQAEVYGTRMPGALLIDGFTAVVKRCQQHRIPVYIVSHKTRFAAQDPTLDLRAGALTWMQNRGFFDAEGLGLTPDQVFFEETRAEKLAQVRLLGCSHFVDDLEEVLQDPGFPSATTGIWFSHEQASGRGMLQAATWADIERLLFC
jgi:hypothetical protein